MKQNQRVRPQFEMNRAVFNMGWRKHNTNRTDIIYYKPK